VAYSLVLVCFFIIVIKYTLLNKRSSRNKNSRLGKIREIYDLGVKYGQEKPVKILGLYYFPCRGIKGIETDHLAVSSYGIKHDR